MKVFSGDDLLSESECRRIGLNDKDTEVEVGVDDRAGTWPCTEVAPAVELAMSKLERWPAHLELLLGPMLKDEEVWAPGTDVFIEDALPRLCLLLLMGMEEAGELVV